MPKSRPVPASQGQTNPGDSFYQYQVLREEVRQHRMVEQLSYELQRVKQRQMDDYLILTADSARPWQP